MGRSMLESFPGYCWLATAKLGTRGWPIGSGIGERAGVRFAVLDVEASARLRSVLNFASVPQVTEVFHNPRSAGVSQDVREALAWS